MRARNMKKALREKLLDPSPVWRADWFTPIGREMEVLSPLLSFLPLGGMLKWRAVPALGLVVSALAERGDEGPAKAREVMRRLMWHMNEDSGNIGWGICEAMGEICAQNPALAEEYGRIVLSYVRNTGRADNYLEHGPLRRGAYWAVGRLGSASPALAPLARELLRQGLADEDAPARGIAAWGVAKMAAAGSLSPSDAFSLRPQLLPLLNEAAHAELLDGAAIREENVSAFAREALDLIETTLKPEENS